MTDIDASGRDLPLDMTHSSDKRDPTQDPYIIKQEAELARLRRNRIAEGFAFALACNAKFDSEFISDLANGIRAGKPLVLAALTLTDTLIAELDK